MRKNVPRGIAKSEAIDRIQKHTVDEALTSKTLRGKNEKRTLHGREREKERESVT